MFRPQKPTSDRRRSTAYEIPLSSSGESRLEKAKANNPDVNELDLSAHELNSNNIRPIADIFSNNSHLMCVNLSGNNLGNKGVASVLKAIANNPSTKIITLNLSDTQINSISPNVIASFLNTNQTLQTLILDNNSLLSVDDTLISLLSSLNSNTVTPLKILSLQKIGLQAHHSIGKLLSSAQSHKTLEEIIFDDSFDFQQIIAQTDLRCEFKPGSPVTFYMKPQLKFGYSR